MRNTRTTARADRFLGVRLTTEELEQLDRFRDSLDVPNRSEAVRALVRGAERASKELPELPVGLRDQLEQVVEHGYAPDLDGSLTLVLTLGLSELGRLYTDRLPALKRAARESADRRQGRRRADREGRGLLER